MNILNTIRALFSKKKTSCYPFKDGSTGGEIKRNVSYLTNFHGLTNYIGIIKRPIYRSLLEPSLFVKPTENMVVKPNCHVDEEGRVYLQYLQDWNTSSSDLSDLVQIMIIAFSDMPPVYTKPKIPSSFSEQKVILRQYNEQTVVQALSCGIYSNPERTKEDVMVTLHNYVGLSAKHLPNEANKPSKNNLLNLEGTIPIMYKGSPFNIPICIWIVEQYPNSPPNVYVTPTKQMFICVSKYVDKDGKVSIPYIQMWNKDSDLPGLIQMMIMAFSELTPLYTKPDTGVQLRRSNLSESSATLKGPDIQHKRLSMPEYAMILRGPDGAKFVDIKNSH
ncbi:unnamed protein product, partial [Meganyctiphanes norvegica]